MVVSRIQEQAVIRPYNAIQEQASHYSHFSTIIQLESRWNQEAIDANMKTGLSQVQDNNFYIEDLQFLDENQTKFEGKRSLIANLLNEMLIIKDLRKQKRNRKIAHNPSNNSTIKSMVQARKSQERGYRTKQRHREQRAWIYQYVNQRESKGQIEGERRTKRDAGIYQSNWAVCI